jgi:hypothetical protein
VPKLFPFWKQLSKIMKTLVKFIQNFTPDSRNRLVTRTLGKLGVVDRDFLEQNPPVKPQAGEFWYCNVTAETIGSGRGVFLLWPLEKLPLIEQDGYRTVDVLHLIPGLYTSQQRRNAMLLYPKRLGPHWIASSELRRHIIQRHRTDDAYGINTVAVVFDGADDWPRWGQP